MEQGYRAIAAAEPRRVRIIDATQPIGTVSAAIWAAVEPLLKPLKTAKSSR